MATVAKVLSAAVLTLLAGQAGAVIINLAAGPSGGPNDVNNPVTISGISSSSIIDIAPIGIADGGTYDAWNAWGDVSGCDANGENCFHGWVHNWVYFVDGDTTTAVQRATLVYATAAQALAAGASVTGISGVGSISFYIPDNLYTDNIGGVSLNVTITTVPEPMTFALLLTGLVGLAWRRSRPCR